MNPALVSIIIPAYQAEPYLLETLNSVKHQTYKHWEILIVNDGSTDRTEELIKQFMETEPECKIHYFQHSQNQGLSATRNTAMQFVKGKYVALLDSDDLWKENHLEVAVSALEANQGDLIYSTVHQFDNNTKAFLGHYGPTQEQLKDFPDSLFTSFSYIQPSTIVMRREIIEIVGLFDTELPCVEDSDYLLRTVAANFKFLHLQTITCCLRRGHSSLTSNIAHIQEGFALVLRKHRAMETISPSARKNAATGAHLMVAKGNLRTNPMKAIEFLFWAWRINPAKLKYLGAIFLAFLFHTSSKLGIHYKQS